MFNLKENEEAYRLHFAKFSKGYGFAVVMTIRCNYSCQVCSYDSQHTCDDEWNISYEVIDAFIEKLKDFKNFKIKPIVCLYGGEPTLELDKCEYLAKKVHELDFEISLYTNAWWGHDETIRKRIKNNIKPHTIFMSIDKYHDNDLQKDIIPIIEEFKENTFLFPCAFLGDEKLTQIKMLYPFLKTQEEAVIKMGRAVDKNGPDIKEDHYGSCRKCAVAVKPNGDIGIDCGHDLKHKCNFTTVFDKSFNLTESYKYFLYFHSFPSDHWCDDHPEFNCCDDDNNDNLPEGVIRYDCKQNMYLSVTNLKLSDLYL